MKEMHNELEEARTERDNAFTSAREAEKKMKGLDSEVTRLSEVSLA